MILRQFLVPETACASYLFGCTTHGKLAVVDPHASLVEEYLSAAEQIGSPIVGEMKTYGLNDAACMAFLACCYAAGGVIIAMLRVKPKLPPGAFAPGLPRREPS